ncbi:hypothetical protein TIFTF001_023464 [Ficus carica]|uniref:Uncharacterized protein n=1 Tax=Ficus carica TaxID=3494 RepID=A0AA88DDR3_FICCA|nr:hypothetical protein TIFTF001_023464 [Ficus carica]
MEDATDSNGGARKSDGSVFCVTHGELAVGGGWLAIGGGWLARSASSRLAVGARDG